LPDQGVDFYYGLIFSFLFLDLLRCFDDGFLLASYFGF
jgi:hypothetical protein